MAEDLFLVPIEDRRRLDSLFLGIPQPRGGLLPSMPSIGSQQLGRP